MASELTNEEIGVFLNGSNPMERIVKIEDRYDKDFVTVIYRDENGARQSYEDKYYPFCWANQKGCVALYGGDRSMVSKKLKEYGISCEILRTCDSEGNVPERMDNGYKYLFKATKPMSQNKFVKFFSDGGSPVYPNDKNDSIGEKNFIIVRPSEGYMIQTGKRQFKGYQDYDNLVRLSFDLETEGLDPEIHSIKQIGIRTNRGFEKIITVKEPTIGKSLIQQEADALIDFFTTIREIDPDVVCGHNVENFDFNFIEKRLNRIPRTMVDLSRYVFGGMERIKKSNRDKVLKLGGEMEYYKPTTMWGAFVVDSLHAVRRAQALNSNIKKSNLKYITKYLKLEKKNRVYIKGNMIAKLYEIKDKRFILDEENGEWQEFTSKMRTESVYSERDERHILRYLPCSTVTTDNGTIGADGRPKNYRTCTGQEIVERYLLDDLYETDKVELSFNQTNFQVCKMLPVAFDKMCTMGTAAIWKYLMMTFSYEKGLAIPELIESRSFTGGLSRLLKVGYVENIIKLDYNSLYPSIILSHDIKSPVDITGSMNQMLEYMLTMREYYKDEKKKMGKQAGAIKERMENGESGLEHELNNALSMMNLYDNIQGVLKVFGNSFFGAFGSGSVFPWSTIECAENTTTIGRMALRLLMHHFGERGYEMLVGDSFTGDTPIFIKYKDTSLIDISPVNELIDNMRIKVDELGREYDASDKPYQVLCRSGWTDAGYIYRHKTEKPLYRVEDEENKVSCDVTEDHSLFNDKQEEIKPSEINEDTKLEFNVNTIGHNNIKLSDDNVERCVSVALNYPDKIPFIILNADNKSKALFVDLFNKRKTKKVTIDNYSKTFVAGWNFLQNVQHN